MKTASNQRSILSFFGNPKSNQANILPKSANSNGMSKPKKELNKNEKILKKLPEDSPVKRRSLKRSRIIESDSEDEQETRISKQTCENDDMECEVLNPEKEIRTSSPPVKLKEDEISSPQSSSHGKPSTSSSTCKIGFSAETVPPLRKTARKQMKRNAETIVDQQVEVVKRLKSSPGTSSVSSKKSEAKANSNAPKRTNCLDKFVFVKTSRNTTVESDKPKVNNESACNKSPLLTSTCSGTKDETSDISSKNVSSELENNNSESENDSSDLKITSQQDSNSVKESSPKTDVYQLDLESENAEKIEEECSSDDVNTIDSSSPTKRPSSPQKSNDEVAKDEKSSKPVCKNPFNISKPAKKENVFDPSKAKYDPIADASWKRNEDVPFSALSKTFEIIEETSGRLKIVEILANFLRSVICLSPEDLLYCIYLCLNKVAPSFEGIELGVGEIYVCRAVAQVTGRSVSMIKNEISEKGDLGIVAEHSKSNQRMMFEPVRLTVKKVFKNLKEIALMSGQASQNKKIDKIKSMFVACKDSEARFLIRFCGGKLRIGLAEQSVLQAIAQACFLSPPGQSYPPEVLNAGKGLSADNLKSKVDEYANILKTTYCECPTFDSIVPVLLEKGMMELPNHCKLEPGIPLKPMLAHPTKGVSEVLKRFEKSKFTCEFKYDGERAQIHLKEDGTVSIFSRNQENNTSKYPDIIARLKDSLGADVKSCVIDSEAVAYDVEEKKILPFQILSTRKRKDANESEIKVQVCVFPFDLLYLNGRNLVTEPFQVRRDLLQANFVEKEGQFTFAKSIDSTNTEDIEEFLEVSIKGNCEGLMVKSLDVDATYEIAKRSHNWLKLKKDYLEGVGDTIDVVVLGGFSGKGKRTGTYGGFLLACYDPDNEEFQSLCKIGTGFTDEDLQQHTTFFKDHVIENPKSYYRYDSSVAPDHWFDAVQVWEIKCADLSISPVHKAAIGIVDSEKGISLRFPRFLRIRDDKSPEEATNSSQIADLYRNQDQIKNKSEPNKLEEDYY